jgi:hypothetical protein
MTNELRPERSLEFYKNRKTHSSLYSTSILIGLCIAIYIYVFNFNSFSETMLVSGTALCLFPIIFGYYGFIAQWMYNNFEKHKFKRPIDLLISASKQFPALVIRPLFNMVHFPLFIPNKSPLFLALGGSFIWSIWLLIFFVVIFPRL